MDTLRCGRLIDHPKFETWKEEMAPGEMWSVFGEKWVTEREVRLVSLRLRRGIRGSSRFSDRY